MGVSRGGRSPVVYDSKSTSSGREMTHRYTSDLANGQTGSRLVHDKELLEEYEERERKETRINETIHVQRPFFIDKVFDNKTNEPRSSNLQNERGNIVESKCVTPDCNKRAPLISRVKGESPIHTPCVISNYGEKTPAYSRKTTFYTPKTEVNTSQESRNGFPEGYHRLTKLINGRKNSGSISLSTRLLSKGLGIGVGAENKLDGATTPSAKRRMKTLLQAPEYMASPIITRMKSPSCEEAYEKDAVSKQQANIEEGKQVKSTQKSHLPRPESRNRHKMAAAVANLPARRQDTSSLPASNPKRNQGAVKKEVISKTRNEKVGSKGSAKVHKLTTHNVNKLQKTFCEKDSRAMVLHRFLNDLLHYQQQIPHELMHSKEKHEKHDPREKKLPGLA